MVYAPDAKNNMTLESGLSIDQLKYYNLITFNMLNKKNKSMFRDNEYVKKMYVY